MARTGSIALFIFSMIFSFSSFAENANGFLNVQRDTDNPLLQGYLDLEKLSFVSLESENLTLEKKDNQLSFYKSIPEGKGISSVFPLGLWIEVTIDLSNLNDVKKCVGKMRVNRDLRREIKLAIEKAIEDKDEQLETQFRNLSAFLDKKEAGFGGLTFSFNKGRKITFQTEDYGKKPVGVDFINRVEVSEQPLIGKLGKKVWLYFSREKKFKEVRSSGDGDWKLEFRESIGTLLRPYSLVTIYKFPAFDFSSEEAQEVKGTVQSGSNWDAAEVNGMKAQIFDFKLKVSLEK